MLPRRFLLLFLLLMNTGVFAQQFYSLRPLATRDSVSLRGLSAPTDSVVWASGTRGTVGKSVNGGRTWQWFQVPGYGNRDFRDIEAFDENTAVIMAVAEPAHLLKTTNGGRSWQLVFADSTKGMFMDAMHFRNARHGIVVGDPVSGKFFVKGTDDGGATWRVDHQAPAALPSEACFAASGTNVFLNWDGSYWMVTGGKTSRLMGSKTSKLLPLTQGAESTGAFSLAVRGEQMAVVGGDFQKDENTKGNCALSVDGGNTWTLPAVPPRGYRSCVIYLDNNRLLSCGTSGVDISRDAGRRWEPVSDEGFHVATQAKNGRTVYLAGSGGRISRLETR